ncbi:MAG: terpene cyclase/mutase family protein [Deltaproteobacteria bacterium]|nr:terpene cyclase/mutase family protein [Deltaproteobacteria bacterium]
MQRKILKTVMSWVLPALMIIFCTGLNALGGEARALAGAGGDRDLSLKMEVQHAIERGLRWLRSRQDMKGFWSQPDHPALSGLVLTAYMGDPVGNYKANPPEFIKKGYEYVARCAKPDGGIYVRDLANYNTSVSMMALQVSGDSVYRPLLKRARNFLMGLQGDFNEKGKIDSPYDGGIGYGGRYSHSDMSNTMFALEALYYTRYLKGDSEAGRIGARELNWAAAVRFIERCQNLPGYNDQPWASDDPQNKGGFVYFPGNSKAGKMTLPSGRIALRSYGSISYAGLLSYIYADMDRNDPRVRAVFDWLQRNYTLDENPGMGPQGLFYYYHTMAKALSLYGCRTLTLQDGRRVDWRRGLVMKLLNLQAPEGFWVNENGRWWERDPVLVTSYAVIALEIISRGL